MENGKPPIAWDNQVKQSMTLRKLLRPSLITMAISGCCTYIPENVRSRQSNANGTCGVFWTVYRTFCLITCLVACARTAAAFPYVPASFVQLNIVKTMWFTQCLVVFQISLKATYSKTGSQKRAFDFWDDNIWPEMEDLGIELPIEKIHKRQRIHVVLAIILIIVNSACNILMQTGLILEDFDVFFAAPFVKSVPQLIADGFFIIMITLIWLVPVFYMMTVSTLLTSSFEAFNESLDSRISMNDTNATKSCQRMRILHLNLGKMVSLFDQDFGCYFAAQFVFSIGISCFLLYQILRNSMEIVTVVLFGFWMTMPLALLALASISAAIVHDAVSLLDLSITVRKVITHVNKAFLNTCI